MTRFGTKSPVAFLRGLSAALVAAMVLAFFVPAPAQGQGLRTRHVREAVSSGQAEYLGRLPSTLSLRLNISLPLRNEPELNELLQQLYDPHSPSFHQFLSLEEFTERFGPTQEDYNAVIRFAQANGLAVTGTSPNRLVVDVTGPVANIEGAFHVNMGVYQHPTEDRTFYAPDQEPTPDLTVPLWHISGLDNFSIPRPASLHRAPDKKKTTGSGPSGYFIGSDMRAAYYTKTLPTGTTALTGTGQSVGLVEFEGYNETDVTNYFKKVGQTLSVAVNGVSTDGSSLSCNRRCDDTEQVLDIEEAISMAPGMSQVRVYVSDTSDVNIFNSMATDGKKNKIFSLSCSWGWDPADPSSDDTYFKEFAAQGQNLFVASGDSGSFSSSSSYVYPADDMYVTAVGGTDLTTASAGGAWKSETAWADSGGGISPDGIGIPSWQTAAIAAYNASVTSGKGSTTYRNCPDVSAEANTDNYICYDGGCAGGWGGTSFAAPRWAGFLALVNQQAVANTGSAVGFINPTLYSIGLSSSYSADFHDITSGSNGTYKAVTGYDLVTGWGTPIGYGLFNSLISALAP